MYFTHLALFSLCAEGKGCNRCLYNHHFRVSRLPARRSTLNLTAASCEPSSVASMWAFIPLLRFSPSLRIWESCITSQSTAVNWSFLVYFHSFSLRSLQLAFFLNHTLTLISFVTLFYYAHCKWDTTTYLPTYLLKNLIECSCKFQFL